MSLFDSSFWFLRHENGGGWFLSTKLDLFTCFSRGTDECNKKQPSDCDTLEYRNGEGKSSNLFDTCCL